MNEKKTKNHKNVYIYPDDEAEEEVRSKRRKESLRVFSTLFKVDPTIDDECTEVVELERQEERRVKLVNEKKRKSQKKETVSSHTIDAIKPVAVKRYSRFITVHVEQFYGSARCISFFCLFHGLGDGSVEKPKFLFK